MRVSLRSRMARDFGIGEGGKGGVFLDPCGKIDMASRRPPVAFAAEPPVEAVSGRRIAQRTVSHLNVRSRPHAGPCDRTLKNAGRGSVTLGQNLSVDTDASHRLARPCALGKSWPFRQLVASGRGHLSSAGHRRCWRRKGNDGRSVARLEPWRKPLVPSRHAAFWRLPSSAACRPPQRPRPATPACRWPARQRSSRRPTTRLRQSQPMTTAAGGACPFRRACGRSASRRAPTSPGTASTFACLPAGTLPTRPSGSAW